MEEVNDANPGTIRDLASGQWGPGSVQNDYAYRLSPEQIAHQTERAEQQARIYREEAEREQARQEASMQRTQAQHLRTAALEAALRVTENGSNGDVLTEAGKIAGFLIDG